MPVPSLDDPTTPMPLTVLPTTPWPSVGLLPLPPLCWPTRPAAECADAIPFSASPDPVRVTDVVAVEVLAAPSSTGAAGVVADADSGPSATIVAAPTPA